MRDRSTLSAAVPPALAILLLTCLGAASARPGKPWFTDVTPSTGIDFVNTSGEHGQIPIIDQNGQGAAIFDFDGDGWMDVFLVGGSTIPRWKRGKNPGNRLYRNRGDWTFEDVTEKAGVRGTAWGCGAAAADYDGDGDADLYVTHWGPNSLYRNDGDGTFTDVTAKAGVGDPSWSSSAAFGDVDGDGDLDLYVSNYVKFDPDDFPRAEKDGKPCLYKGVETGCGPWCYEGERDTLYRNNGDGTFTDVSTESGLKEGGRGFGVILADFDSDGDTDVYVGCDVMPNQYLINNGKGQLAPAPKGGGGTHNRDGKQESGMGVAAADADGDGDLDVFTTNFAGETNTLSLNEGGLLTDRTREAGLEGHAAEMGWGAALADLDNDSVLDAFVVNGHIYPQVDSLKDPGDTYRQRERLYVGLGDGQFREAGPGDGWRRSPRYSTRGMALGDLDNDGDLDIVLVRHNDPVSIWRNDRGGRFLTVILKGKAPNTDGIGARLHLKAGEREWWRFALPHQGYQSSHDPRIHFGLGNTEKLDLLEVHWPSGKLTRLTDLAPNQIIKVTHN